MKTIKYILITLVIGGIVVGFNSKEAKAIVVESKSISQESEDSQSPDLKAYDIDKGPNFVPGEIIVKFKAEEEQSWKIMTGSSTQKASPKLSTNIKNRIHMESNFRLKGEAISRIKGMPDKIKSLIKEDTTLKPVLSALHKKFSKGKTEQQINQERFNRLSQKRRMPVKAPKNYHLANIYIMRRVKTNGKSILEICHELSQDPDIEYAEPNYRFEIYREPPNDEHYSVMWPLNNTKQEYPAPGGEMKTGTEDADIDAPEAWDIHTGEDVIIAVLDTGVDYTHDDLVDNMWINEIEQSGAPGVDDDDNGFIDDVYGYDFHNSKDVDEDDEYDGPEDIVDSDPMDDHGHGTHCAGTIAAVTNNDIGISGVCWNGKIMALKFLSSGGSGDTEDAVGAFYYAIDNESLFYCKMSLK